MRSSIENNTKIMILTSVSIPLIYLLIDYVNLPALVGFNVENVNIDIFSIVVNTTIVVLLYLISYYYIDTKQIKKDENSVNTAKVLLINTYRECLSNIDLISSRYMLTKFVIPKVDFNKVDQDNRIVNNLQCLPFENTQEIMSLAQSGYVLKNELERFIFVKSEYKTIISLKITFFDLSEDNCTNEEQKIMLENINNRLSILTNTLKQSIKELESNKASG